MNRDIFLIQRKKRASVPSSQATHCVAVMKTKKLILFGAIIAVHCERKAFEIHTYILWVKCRDLLIGSKRLWRWLISTITGLLDIIHRPDLLLNTTFRRQNPVSETLFLTKNNPRQWIMSKRLIIVQRYIVQ
jgi:hypothetical protein